MKKLLLFIPLIFVFSFLFSQEFAPVGAKWYYSYDDPYYNYYNYLSYESVGDTIIGGKKCNIVETTSSAFFYDSIRVFLHTNGNKVEAFIFDNFYTLFDFDALPGDTWMVPNFEAYEFEPCDSLGRVVVDSIGTEIINGKTLKVLYVKFDNWYPTPSWFWQGNYQGPTYGKVIEIIGSLDMLFPRAACNFHIPYPSPLRCYSDSIFGFYETGLVDSCNQIITSVKSLEATKKMNVFPNPSEGRFILNGIEAEAEVFVYDFQGILVFAKNFAPSERAEIKLEETGIYLIRVMQKGHQPEVMKVAVNRNL